MQAMESYQKREKASTRFKLAALLLRRKAINEKTVYDDIVLYNPAEYEVLLRHWPAEPYLNHLAAFSGPLVMGNEPELTLIMQCFQWSRQLAANAGYPNEKGIRGSKAVFLSSIGGYANTDDPTLSNSNVFLFYIIPVTNAASKIVSCFPQDSTLFPRFYCLGETLRKMYTNTIDLHPSTREMLSMLDNWLREQHTLSNALNQIFVPSADKRIISVTQNPFHYDKGILKRTEKYERAKAYFDNIPVDKYITNPLYGSGVKFGDKPNIHIVNKYFGMGPPDYSAVGTTLPLWRAEQGDNADWVDNFPLHKAACEGDVGGIRRSVNKGHSPNELDNDNWAPLHYACWYGELDSVIALIEECSASTGIRNTSGSTPLHFAAGNGHSFIVEYLLENPLVNPGALDNDGKSPLAICLECKTNDWKTTEQLLREAYQEQVDNQVQIVRTSMNRQSIAVNTTNEDETDLENRGSCADITDEKQKPIIIRSVDINFMDKHNQLVQFYKGKNTSALEALQDACRLIHLGLEFQFVFALWIVSESLAIQLGDTDKPLKLIAKWPILMKRFAQAPPTESPALYMRRNVFFPCSREATIKDPIALQYLYYDAQHLVVTAYYPCSEGEAIDLAIITMQLKYGDHNSALHGPRFLKDRLFYLLPFQMLKNKRRVQFERQILARHEDLTQCRYSTSLLHQKYLELCRKWPYYGATFYEGLMNIKVTKTSVSSVISSIKPSRKQTAVRIGINNLGFHIVSKETNIPLQSYPLNTMDWDMIENKNIFGLKTKDGSLNMTFQTKQAPLLHSLASQMKKELEAVTKFVKDQKQNDL